MTVAVGSGWIAEAPAPRLSCDHRLVCAVNVDPGCRKDAAVVCATRVRAVLIDRAPIVDEHRAVPLLVVAETTCPRGSRGAGNSSSGGMWASVSLSCGPMWMNCDDVQHAVQLPHGTSDGRSPRSAACMPATHEEKSPAGRSGRRARRRRPSSLLSHLKYRSPSGGSADVSIAVTTAAGDHTASTTRRARQPPDHPPRLPPPCRRRCSSPTRSHPQRQLPVASSAGTTPPCTRPRTITRRRITWTVSQCVVAVADPTFVP